MKEKPISQPITRRNFLELAGSAVVLSAYQSPNNHRNNRQIIENTTIQPPLEATKKADTPLNDLTAIGTVSLLLGLIGDVAIRKKEFGPKTAIPMISAEAVRLGALAIEDKSAFEHETAELTSSYPLVPLLVGLADIGSKTKATATALFEKSNFREIYFSEIMALEESRPHQHPLPNIETANISECQDYLVRLQEEIVTLTTANFALATIIGPLSTYLSASAAADGIAPISRALTEYNYVKSVIKQKSSSIKEVDYTVTKNQSAQQTNQQVNGTHGLTAAILTQAGNVNGGLLIGDPPVVASLIQRPQDHTTLSAVGLTYSEISNLAVQLTWLKSIGIQVNPSELFNQFTTYQAKTCITLIKSLTNQSLREASFGQHQAAATQLASMLKSLSNLEWKPETIQTIKDFFDQQPDPVVEFGVSKYIENKLDSLIKRKPSQIVDIDESTIDLATNLNQILQNPDPAQRFRQLQNVQLSAQQLTAIAITANFMDLFKTEGSSESINQLSSLGNLVSVQNPSLKQIFDQTENLSTQPSVNLTDLEQLANRLSVVGPEQISTVLTDVLNSNRGILDHDTKHSTGLFDLSHTSQEVGWALITQLAAVPSAIHLAEKTITAGFGLSSNENVDATKTPTIVATILMITSALSGVADNVAAYLFGRRLLEDTLKNSYPEVYSTSEELQSFANISALFAAVVGGSLSKIGNGPNFLISEMETTIDPQSNIQTHSQPISLGKSFLNNYSGAQTLIIQGMLNSWFNSIKPN